jgi:hypothetical protein
MKIKSANESNNLLPNKITGIVEFCDGTINPSNLSIEYRMLGLLHRENGPAEIFWSGEKFWYFNDSLHREDGPAFESITGMKWWYLNGKLFDSEEQWKIEVEKLKKHRLHSK